MIPTLLLVVLSQAQPASEYPKVIRKDGQVCVQTLGAKGSVEESCRSDTTEYKAPASSRAPLQADAPVELRPVPRLQSSPQPVTASAQYWATAKQNWALAFKIGAVGALTSTLVSSIAALIAASSGVPHAADPYIATAIVSGAGTALFVLIAVMLDRAGFKEIDPDYSVSPD